MELFWHNCLDVSNKRAMSHKSFGWSVSSRTSQESVRSFTCINTGHSGMPKLRSVASGLESVRRAISAAVQLLGIVSAGDSFLAGVGAFPSIGADVLHPIATFSRFLAKKKNDFNISASTDLYTRCESNQGRFASCIEIAT
jgi:hypothetical protein